MKKLTLSLLLTLAAGYALPALAADVEVTSAMQSCKTNEDCALITNSCSDNCGLVPITKSNLGTVQGLYQTKCGKPMNANPQCNMNPPIAPVCINARCTIDYPFANNAGVKDYKAGAYPVAEKPVPSKVPAAPYKNVDDTKNGFSAYNLPQGEVAQKTVGQIYDRVYVPPSAPVSGGNYVPVGVAPQAAPAPTPAPSNIPPAAVPMKASNATAPTPIYPVPSAPVPQNAAPETYVPAPTVPTVPAPGLAPVPRTPTAAVAPVPQVGAPGVPQAPAGSVPIPPSDLKPAPTFVPPTGTAVPVAPEDPGAPPPAGVSMSLMPDGTIVKVSKAESDEKKSFSGLPAKTSSGAMNE